MKRIVVVVMLNVFQHLFVNGQNLVPNPSFEIYTACPTSLAEIYKAPPWFQPCTLFSSTDFFHSCSTFQAGVPSNFVGYQIPKSGLGYAGFIVFSTVTSPPSNFPRPYREYIEVKLIDSLKQGKEYCVEFYISLAGNNYNIITNAVGAYFTRDSVINNDFKNLQDAPQIQNPSGNLLNDTSGWMKVSGAFIATGGEQFMTIGNFKNDVNTYADTLSTSAQIAYLYIDDVSVIDCANSISEQTKETEITISPNPFTSQTTISFFSEENNTIIKVINVIGEVIAQSTINGKQYTLDMSSASKGIYFLQIIDEKKTVVNRKVVVE